MSELVLFVAGFAGGFAASVLAWPAIRTQAVGASAEIVRLRTHAKALEDVSKGAR